jgi:hypothetical protein
LNVQVVGFESRNERRQNKRIILITNIHSEKTRALHMISGGHPTARHAMREGISIESHFDFSFDYG